MNQIAVRLDSSCSAEATWNLPPSRPRLLLRWDGAGRPVILSGPSGVLRSWQEPEAVLAWMEKAIGHREFGTQARWVGYLSYDLGRLFETLPSVAKDDLGLPGFVFALVSGHAREAEAPREGEAPAEPAFNRNHSATDMCHFRAEPAGPRAVVARPIGPGTARLNSAARPLERDRIDEGRLGRSLALPSSVALSTFTRDGYLRAVAQAIEYIRAGDVFQVNLSQRFTTALHDSCGAIYARLLQAAPARFGGLLDFGDHALICNSPELFLRVTPDSHTGRRRVLTRPIKGTRPRRPGMDAELRNSLKDQAELNMIVDLERNDLGRVCEIGSVRVSGPRSIETHPTVYHGSATIEGDLRAGVSLVDLLRATFPGGSITGAPKIRAMQIIDALEPVRRGPYCGAIGYIAADGRIEFNVAIRTIIVKDGLAHVPVGGGIVADSDPAAEYEETLVKAQAMLAALGA